MNYTTYYFGAGASANAIPTVTRLVDSFREIAKYIRLETQRHKVSGGQHLNNIEHKKLLEVADDIDKLANYSEDFGTIDTYFKKLFLNNEIEETNRLKNALSYFFYLWQNCNCEIDKEANWKRIDLRYLSLISNILQVSNSTPTWNSKFKILTWNYDFQIISALKEFSTKQTEEIIKDYGIFPLNKLMDNQKYGNVVYLNGISATFNYANQIDCRFEENYCTPIENVYELFEDLNTKENINNSYINFGWELHSNELSQAAINQAQVIMSRTQNLVIVGYSFPYYNHEIDSMLLNSLPRNANIIYQDMNADLDGFKEKFDLYKMNIKILSDEQSLNQFLIPN